MPENDASAESGPLASTSAERDGTAWDNAHLFWVSLFALFMELLLIRWVATEIRIFAYLQNTILVVCFFGLGLGLFTAREPIKAQHAIWALVSLVALLAVPPTRVVVAAISELLQGVGAVSIWDVASSESPISTAVELTLGLYLVLLVMLLIVEAFIPVGRLLGRLMDRHPRPILAYSINVMGSLVGIWLFVLLSMKHQPPVVWFGVLSLLALPFLAIRRPTSRTALLGLVALVIAASFADRDRGAIQVVWSPYQKLALFEDDRPMPGIPPGSYYVHVNNVGFHTLADLRPEVLKRIGPEYPSERIGFSLYDIPLLLHPAPKRVLVVGSGGGNDVAGALRSGAEQITAVEIDPAVVEFGRSYHPERPYASDRVNVIIDDARSYFARSSERFDLVIFGALDAHATTAMTNAPLDHYVYTLSSLRRARELLEDDGMLVLVFYPVRPFLGDRLAVVLRDTFGSEPLVLRVPTPRTSFGSVAMVLVAGNTAVAQTQIARSEPLAAHLQNWNERYPTDISYTTQATTDDWPYLFLARPMIPALFPLLAGLLWLLVLYARRQLGAPAGTNLAGWSRSSWHFFFLGAAFLLLEVQNISKAAVVLGNTWLVNAVIISGVLMMVLVANAIVAAWPRIPLGPVYGALIGSALVLYFIDLARFAFLPFATKAIVVGTLTTLPMLFSGIVFVRSFKVAPRKDFALGANLYGALVGALLQSVSFLTGIKFLLLIVAAFYGLAFFTRTREFEFLTRRAPQPAGKESLAGVSR